MEKAYRVRIYPNKTQENLIQKTFGCVRYVYNHFLGRRIKEYEDNKSTLTFSKCSKELTILKKKYIWLKEPDKCSLQNSLRDLDNAYKNFFNKPKNGYPKFKSKKYTKKSYRTNYTNDNIRIEGNKIRLPKLGLVKFRDKYNIQGYILNVTISQSSSGKYFVSMICTDIELEPKEKTGNYIGIDLGIKDFAITSEGIKFSNPRYLNRSLNRLAILQQRLSRKTRGSKRFKKAKIKLARLYEHISSQRKDFLNKLSTQLINLYDIICVETLNIKSLLEHNDKDLSRNISDVSWYEFIRRLEYKANWYGKTLSKIDTYFPSSQLCHCCGYQNEEVKDTSIREWTCPICNEHHDRDINAAINILNEGLTLV